MYGGSEFGVDAHPSAVGEGTALDEDQVMDDAALHRTLSDGGLAMRDQFRRDYGLEGAIAEWRKAFAPRLPRG